MSRRAARSGAGPWPNSVRQDGPYPHADVEAIAAFFVDGLADVAARRSMPCRSRRMAPRARCSAGDGLALPVLDYEHDGPDAARARPTTASGPASPKAFSPRLRGGLNLGAQLFWQAQAFPQAFARADAFVTYPQYWAWRLTGVAATERPRSAATPTFGRPAATGSPPWSRRRAGPGSWHRCARPSTARPFAAGARSRLGLRPGLPVACGIHDSNASLLPHLQGGAAPATIVSSGTWVISFAVGGSLVGPRPRAATRWPMSTPIAVPCPRPASWAGASSTSSPAARPVEPDAATVGMRDRRVASWLFPASQRAADPFRTASVAGASIPPR